jgi:hypothetical protein
MWGVERIDVSDNYKTIFGMYLVDCVIEGISLIYSVQNGSLHVSAIIENKSDLKIIVASCGNDNVFSIEIRVEY